MSRERVINQEENGAKANIVFLKRPAHMCRVPIALARRKRALQFTYTSIHAFIPECIETTPGLVADSASCSGRPIEEHFRYVLLLSLFIPDDSN